MKRILLIIGGYFLLLIVALVTAVWMLGRDIPPPDTSDLVRVRPVVPPEMNAYPLFAAATNSFYWPKDESIVGRYLAGEAVDEEKIRDILTRNETSLNMIRRGVTLPACQVPEVEGLESIIPYLATWQKLGKTLALQTRIARLHGGHAKATESCVVLLRFGDMIQANGEGLLNHLVGRYVLGLGFQQAEDLVTDASVSHDNLARIADTLATIRPSREGLVEALKAEYRLFTRAVDQIHRGEISIDDLSSAESSANHKRRKPPVYLFQPNATKQILAEHVREMIQNSGRRASSMTHEKVEETLGLTGNKLRLIFRPNGVGRILCAIVLPAYEAILDRKFEGDVLLAATRLLTALRRYELQNDKLPEQLDVLVPDFLPALPLDPYNGEPFRYSSERGMIYSVGRNLTDEGGSSEGPNGPTRPERQAGRFSKEDVVFKLHPAPAPSSSNTP